MKKILLLITILLSSIALADVPADCDANMINYWKLNETSGDAIDYIGNDDGIVTGATQGLIGQVDKAYYFDGNDDYINAGNSVLSGNTGPFTVSAWFNTTTTSVSSQTIVAKDDRPAGNSKRMFQIQTFGDDIIAYIWDDSTGGYLGKQLTNYIIPNQWYHVALVYHGGSDVRLYVDGTNITTVFSGGSFSGIDDTDANLMIGIFNSSGSLSRDFNGMIDEVAVHDKALTASEVLLQYQYGLDGNDYCYSETGGGPGYAIPEFSSVGLVLIAAMFALLMVYRKKKE